MYLSGFVLHVAAFLKRFLSLCDWNFWLRNWLLFLDHCNPRKMSRTILALPARNWLKLFQRKLRHDHGYPIDLDFVLVEVVGLLELQLFLLLPEVNKPRQHPVPVKHEQHLTEMLYGEH
jgi:hypothetical protein